MTPQGFLPIEIETPDKPLDKLLQFSKSWAAYYNKKSYDIFDVTTNSLTIEALNENAYYYWNLGVKYNYDVKYILKIVFEENQKYTLTFTIKEISTNATITKTKIADFYTSDGKLKDDFKEVKPSLENTVNNIVKSYANFIAQ